VKRAIRTLAASQWNSATAIDCVLLDSDERQRRRSVLTGENGTKVLLDLPRPTRLHHGDGLVLEDGTIVSVTGRPEPLIEITAPDRRRLARLAWHLGNRHADVQIVGDKLRIRRDHVLEEMLRGLGAEVTSVEAPFDPEGGAYHRHNEHSEES
jgi:urease accessory protein